MNILVIGAGSAGRRFISLLIKQKHQTYFFCHRKDIPIPANCTPLADLSVLPPLDGALITSPPHTHAPYANKLIKQNIPLLIEKPLTNSLGSARAILKQALDAHVFVMLGFNLRFLPIVAIIKTAIQKKIGTVWYVLVCAGYYLPFWRKHKIYTETYSAHYAQGGGVALDLIHEIDLVCNWFGPAKQYSITSKKLSNLAVDCEDYVQITAHKPFPIQITLDYLSHIQTRTYHIVGSEGSVYCDIYNQKYTYTKRDGTTEMLTDPPLFDLSATYEPELINFLTHLNSSSDGVDERSLGIDALQIALSARKHV